MIYLDNNATTKLNSQVLAKMNEVYQLSALNSSSIHAYGRKASSLVEDARAKIKNLLNASNYNIVFTSGGSEANNFVLNAFTVEKIIYSTIEHSSIYNVTPQATVIRIGADENSIIDLEQLEQELAKINTPNFLVSVMLANNETGALQPVKEAAKLVHQKGGLIHTDIVQAIGKIPIDLEDLNVDLASISAHKFAGPQGVGALLFRKGLTLLPFIVGGSQETGLRGGTTNVAGIVGFAESLEIATAKIGEYQNVQKLRDYLEAELAAKIDSSDLKIFAKSVARLPNTSYISVRANGGQAQMINFDLNGIMVSAGTACSSKTVKPSRVLLAMGVSEYFANNAIRVSLGLDNNKDEIDKVVIIWKEFYEANRKN